MGGRTVLVSSSGGVLLDLLALQPWWGRSRSTWVAVPAVDTREFLADADVRWVPELRPTQVRKLFTGALTALAVLRAEPVAVVVSAGSGVAVPWFLAARVLGITSLWVETLNVLDRPGLAARLCAGLATAVVVQHPGLVDRHRRSVLVGELY